MKVALCASVALICQVAVSLAAESTGTAYSALRVVGKQLGADSLNRVVEVRGRFGQPEPETWKVTLDDPSARGGIREVDVQHGRVTAERTPVSRTVGPHMNFNQLNLDSEGVFTVVNQEMQKVSITFDRADYLLKSGGKGAPVWHVELFSGQNRTGEFDISADNGNILKHDFEKKGPKAPVVIDDHAYVQPAQPPPPPTTSRRVVTVDPAPRRYPDEVPPRYSADTRRYPEEVRRYPEETRRYPEEVRRYPDDPRAVPPPPPDYYVDDRDDDYRSDGRPLVDKIERHFEKRGRQFKNFFSGNGWTDR